MQRKIINILGNTLSFPIIELFFHEKGEYEVLFYLSIYIFLSSFSNEL